MVKAVRPSRSSKRVWKGSSPFCSKTYDRDGAMGVRDRGNKAGSGQPRGKESNKGSDNTRDALLGL